MSCLMKKILKYVGLGISAASLLFSCAKSEEYSPGGTIDMTVVAGDPSVKTVIDEYESGGQTRYGVLWEAGDVLGGVIKVHGTGFTTIGRRERAEKPHLSSSREYFPVRITTVPSFIRLLPSPNQAPPSSLRCRRRRLLHRAASIPRPTCCSPSTSPGI